MKRGIKEDNSINYDRALRHLFVHTLLIKLNRVLYIYIYIYIEEVAEAQDRRRTD